MLADTQRCSGGVAIKAEGVRRLVRPGVGTCSPFLRRESSACQWGGWLWGGGGGQNTMALEGAVGARGAVGRRTEGGGGRKEELLAIGAGPVPADRPGWGGGGGGQG